MKALLLTAAVTAMTFFTMDSEARRGRGPFPERNPVVCDPYQPVSLLCEIKNNRGRVISKRRVNFEIDCVGLEGDYCFYVNNDRYDQGRMEVVFYCNRAGRWENAGSSWCELFQRHSRRW